MKLLILGAGVVGRCLATTARRLLPQATLVIADRVGSRASAVARAIPDSFALELDVLDRPALLAAMARADLVASAIGPSSRFGLPLLDAAIEARRPFLDLADDPETTVAILARSEAARAAGVPIVTGCGASPGITNLLAVRAAEGMDLVERVVTGWGQGGFAFDDDDDIGPDNAAILHWVDQIRGTVPVWRDGQLTRARPLEPVTVDWPGIGEVTTRLVGHPEAVTLPRRFPFLRESINVIDFSSYVIASLRNVRDRVDSGRDDLGRGARRLADHLSTREGDTLLSRKALSFNWHQSLDLLTAKRWLPPLFALASGSRDGRAVTVGASLDGTLPGGIGCATGIPAAIGVAMLAEGRVQPGVHAPEEAFEARFFLSRLAPFLIDEDGVAPLQAVRMVGQGALPPATPARSQLAPGPEEHQPASGPLSRRRWA